MARSPSRLRAYTPDPEAEGRFCDAPGCNCPAAHKAPKSRDSLREYHWFCLDHVRLYNASWDYCKGMDPAQIEAQLRDDVLWRRPSWPLGKLALHAMDDALAALLLSLLSARTRRRPPPAAPPPDWQDALSVLGLVWPVPLDDMKRRYKALVKRHHPDANGGDKDEEERLKIINQAYSLLRRVMTPA